MYQVSIFVLKDIYSNGEIVNSPTQAEVIAAAREILPELGSTMSINSIGAFYAANYETDRSGELLTLVSGGRCNIDSREISDD